MARSSGASLSFAVFTGVSLVFLGVGLTWTPTIAKDVPYGKPADVAYAKKLWPALVNERLVGPKRIIAHPNTGKQPHGSIQQILAATATVDGLERRVVVKVNHAGDDLKLIDAYTNPAASLSHYAIMAKREAGYDPAHGDWFWVVYDANGVIAEHEGVAIAGRADTGNTRGCIGCHVKKGGSDFEVLTPQ